jgi:hypothetical protein
LHDLFALRTAHAFHRTHALITHTAHFAETTGRTVAVQPWCALDFGHAMPELTPFARSAFARMQVIDAFAKVRLAIALHLAFTGTVGTIVDADTV